MNEIIINVIPQEARVVLKENGVLAEVYIERTKGRGIAGSVYKGRVIRVLQGIQSAFVDISHARSAFLHVDDFLPHYHVYEGIFDAQTDDFPAESHSENFTRVTRDSRIEDLLEEGQEILVQVAKEPLGTKGARLTSHISLPGRYLVFMPTVSHIGVSRRIEDINERERLRNIIERIKPENTGLIARTACENVAEEEIIVDLKFLTNLWSEIQDKTINAKAPCLIHQDINIVLRAVRDLFTHEVKDVIIDSRDDHENILKFMDRFMPSLKDRVKLYEDPEPIFEAYGVEVEIENVLSKKVWLKSGGYIFIEQTEALVVIDVNTGKFVGRRNMSDTVLKTNLEAAREIAYQLRLRNIGGIIIIDFIDMVSEEDRQKVYNIFHEALKRDKVRSNILKISEMGLVEMTRKRTRESIGRLLCDPCEYCEGSGIIKSNFTIFCEIFRDLKKEAMEGLLKTISVAANPEIASMIYDEENESIENLERDFSVEIKIESDPKLHHDEYKIYSQEDKQED